MIMSSNCNPSAVILAVIRTTINDLSLVPSYNNLSFYPVLSKAQ